MFEKVRDLFYEAKGIDLCEIVHDMITFGNITSDDIKALNQWVKSHSCKYKMEKVILYHGTSRRHAISDEGIKKTTSRTKRSLQSAPGYVYLSMYPGSALQFGQMAYPGEEIALYAVEVPLLDLVVDHDQLKNKRLWSRADANIGTTLADSLVHGSGARIKRDAHPYEVRDITDLYINELASKAA